MTHHIYDINIVNPSMNYPYSLHVFAKQVMNNKFDKIGRDHKHLFDTVIIIESPRTCWTFQEHFVSYSRL